MTRKAPPRRRTPRHQKPDGHLAYEAEAELALSEAGLTWQHVLWYRGSPNGKVTFRGRIHAPPPRTIDDLYVLIHELGHFHLHVAVRADGKLQLRPGFTHIHEFEAERWAHDWFALHGIELPDRVTRAAKAYVRYKIAVDFLAGIEIDSTVAEWAEANELLARLAEPEPGEAAPRVIDIRPEPLQWPLLTASAPIEPPSAPLRPEYVPWPDPPSWPASPAYAPWPQPPPEPPPMSSIRRAQEPPLAPVPPVRFEVLVGKAPRPGLLGRLVRAVRSGFRGQQ